MRFVPNARDRWLALGLLLAVLVLAYLLLIHPWFTAPLLAINQDIVSMQEREQRVAAQLAQRPQLEERLQQVQAELASRPGLMHETTEESAAAALGVRLQDAVAQASPGNRACTVSNRTPLPGNRSEAAFTRVALQVRLRCGVEEMAKVLHVVETGAPRLFVENLNILAQRYQASPQETGTGLDVSFELVGYLQPMLPGQQTDDAVVASQTTPAPTAETTMPSAPDVVPGDVEVLQTEPAEAGNASGEAIEPVVEGSDDAP